MTPIALFPSATPGFVPAGASAGVVGPAASRGCGGEGRAAARLAIVVPARDAGSLHRTLRGLAMETAWDAHCTVLVATGDGAAAALAGKADAQLLPVGQGSDGAGMTLEAVLRRAAQAQPAADWVVVVQGGSDVAPGFVEGLRLAIADARDGADALQCRQGRRGATALPAAARPRLGLNGFALSRAALQRFVSHGAQACAGWRVRGVDGALLLDDGAHHAAGAPWEAPAPLRALRALLAATGHAA
ncbi:hypothetical protein [Azohydromonas lata]|uniref:hypothetical protein n=1 Tax=Azohydromonas lata TaxID=45677 RepID=UPI0008325F46|nr:hypothetical protein [Azohydromonas lata]